MHIFGLWEWDSYAAIDFCWAPGALHLYMVCVCEVFPYTLKAGSGSPAQP